MSYSTPAVTYAAPAMTYAAPATYAAPISNQPVDTISPERFQLILQGQPLTPEEIAQMTGAAPQAAPVGTVMAAATTSMVAPTTNVAVPTASAVVESTASPVGTQ